MTSASVGDERSDQRVVVVDVDQLAERDDADGRAFPASAELDAHRLEADLAARGDASQHRVIRVAHPGCLVVGSVEADGRLAVDELEAELVTLGRGEVTDPLVGPLL